MLCNTVNCCPKYLYVLPLNSKQYVLKFAFDTSASSNVVTKIPRTVTSTLTLLTKARKSAGLCTVVTKKSNRTSYK